MVMWVIIISKARDGFP